MQGCGGDPLPQFWRVETDRSPHQAGEGNLGPLACMAALVVAGTDTILTPMSPITTVERTQKETTTVVTSMSL